MIIQTIYLIAVSPLTDVGYDFFELKKLAGEHGGVYMPKLSGKATLAEASFAFASDDRRQEFIAALSGELPEKIRAK